LFLKDLLALEGLLGIFDVLEDLKEGYAMFPHLKIKYV
jgi:hypothetical protein